MTTIAARPRWHAVLLVLLLVLQVASVIQQVLETTSSATRPPWVVAVNGSSLIALLCGMLTSSRYPRVTWLLIGVSAACLVTSVIAVRQLAR